MFVLCRQCDSDLWSPCRLTGNHGVASVQEKSVSGEFNVVLDLQSSLNTHLMAKLAVQVKMS